MTGQRAALSILLLAVTAGGCGARRLALSALPTPSATAWHTTAEGTAPAVDPGELSAWWQRLHDSTLNGLIERSISNNPDVRIAQLRLRQARAQRAQTEAALWPSVSTSDSGSLRRSGTQVLSPDGGGGFRNITTGSYGATLDASWEPDIFGGLHLTADGATADAAATWFDLNAARVSLVAEVARVYGELRTVQARLDIARRNEASQAETLELTGFRAQAGLVSSVDVEQARANLEQTRAQVPSLESSIAQSTFQLATLAGQEPAAMTDMLSVPAPLPTVPDDVAIGIPADVLRQRPDLKAAEARIVAETARAGAARAERYPQFSLSGSLGIQVLKGAGSGGTSLITSMAGNVLQPLFNRGRIRQQIEAQTAVQEQAIVTYESTVLTALRDVESALVALEASRQRLAALQEAANAATAAELLARNQYSAGLTDFQTVLNTQRSALTVQDSAATTTGERLAALIQLFKALGGGWSSAVPAS